MSYSLMLNPLPFVILTSSIRKRNQQRARGILRSTILWYARKKILSTTDGASRQWCLEAYDSFIPFYQVNHWCLLILHIIYFFALDSSWLPSGKIHDMKVMIKWELTLVVFNHLILMANSSSVLTAGKSSYKISHASVSGRFRVNLRL